VLLIKIHLKWKQTQHQISGFFNLLNPIFAPRPQKVLADKVNVPISIGDAHQQATRSDLVLVASGTAALELALLGVPMVVVYK
jgi:lipid A disaccharide synthetase